MNKNCAIIIAPEQDVHAFAVKREAELLGLRTLIIDSAKFANPYRLVSHLTKANARSFLYIEDDQAIDLESVVGLWWRRPRLPIPNNTLQHPAVRKIVEGECTEAFFGVLNGSIANSFNTPSRSRLASYKPLQLQQATLVGLNIPDTLITNEPLELKEFVLSRSENAIYKMFKGVMFEIFETRKFRTGDLDEVWRVRHCPMIVQEFINGMFDVRVTVVGEKVFAARIDYDVNSDVIDSRFAKNSTSPHHLPEDVTAKLISLTFNLGLVYSAIDLRFNPEMGYVFFELNPDGQYLWTEVEADLPISRALAMRLLHCG